MNMTLKMSLAQAFFGFYLLLCPIECNYCQAQPKPLLNFAGLSLALFCQNPNSTTTQLNLT